MSSQKPLENVPRSERSKVRQADDVDQEIYDKTPVENFGLQLMQAMGFSQERGIGRTNRGQLVQPLILKPRPKGLGLGADPEGLSKQQKEYQQMFKTGNRLRIINGPHKDLDGRILSSQKDSEVLLVELQISEQKIKVNKADVKVYGAGRDEEEDYYQGLEIGKKKEGQDINKQGQDKKKIRRLKWVIPGIYVKSVDKKSVHYLKKMKVLDCNSESTFECQIVENGKKTLVENMTERDVQTVIPKIDELVIVLRGEHRGLKGRIKSRDKKSESVIIQSVEEFEMLKFKEDDVAAYED